PLTARMGEALDSRSGADESGNRHAFRPFPPGRRPLGIRRAHAGELQRIHQGPRGPAGPLYVLIHSRGIGAAESQRGQVELSCSTRGENNVNKILIAAGVACALTLAGCGGGEKPAPKADAGATPAAGGAAAMPDMDNGATITGKVI